MESRLINFSSVFDVKAFGATGRGMVLDTVFIQKTIDACFDKGGGAVYFPPGTYLTGTIHLKSNVHLHIEAGATILGSPDLRDYHKPRHLSFGCDNMNAYRVNQLIYGRKVENISITGGGKIDCNAKAFFAQMKEAKRLAELAGKPWESLFGPIKWRPRATLHLFCCHNVLLEGVTLTENAVSAIQIVGCSIVNIDRIHIDNDLKWFLTDGIEVHASSNVNIRDSVITVWDDPVAIYQGISTELEEPLEGECLEQHPNENITVSNCVMNTFSNIRINGANGGRIRNVFFDNVVFNSHSKGYSFAVNIQNWYTNQWAHASSEHVDYIYEQTTEIENIVFSNFTATGCSYPFLIDGEDHVGKTVLGKAGMGKIRNISFVNCEFHIQQEGFIIGSENLRVEDIRFDNVRFYLEDRLSSKPTDAATLAYPIKRPIQCWLYKDNKLSGGRLYELLFFPQALYFRYVDNLHLHNVVIARKRNTPGIWSGAIRCDNVSRLRLEHIALENVVDDETKEASITLNDVECALIQSCVAPEGTELFLKLDGRETRNIVLLSNDLTQANLAYRTGEDVNKDALRCLGNLYITD